MRIFIMKLPVLVYSKITKTGFWTKVPSFVILALIIRS